MHSHCKGQKGHNGHQQHRLEEICTMGLVHRCLPAFLYHGNMCFVRHHPQGSCNPHVRHFLCDVHAASTMRTQQQDVLISQAPDVADELQ